MKEDKYTKNLAKNQICAIFHMRDTDMREIAEKRFTQINKALYGDVMLTSLLKFISIKKKFISIKKKTHFN